MKVHPKWQSGQQPSLEQGKTSPTHTVRTGREEFGTEQTSLLQPIAQWNCLN